jgi:hypothetical protein
LLLKTQILLKHSTLTAGIEDAQQSLESPMRQRIGQTEYINHRTKTSTTVKEQADLNKSTVIDAKAQWIEIKAGSRFLSLLSHFFCS